MRAVLCEVEPFGAQAPMLPAASTARNCTSVSPSAVMFTDEPASGPDHVVPPLVDVRYW